MFDFDNEYKRYLSSDNDGDPLSLFAEEKHRYDASKKERPPHSKEISKERKHKDNHKIKERHRESSQSKERRKTDMKLNKDKTDASIKKERKKREKTSPKQKRPKPTSSMSHLIGVKVSNNKNVINETDVKNNCKERRNINDEHKQKLEGGLDLSNSDCCSQGKSSLTSLTSVEETIGSNILIDGLFSMDEIKTVSLENNITPDTKTEQAFRPSVQKEMQHTNNIPIQVKNTTSVNTNSNNFGKVKQSCSKLIKFRRQKAQIELPVLKIQDPNNVFSSHINNIPVKKYEDIAPKIQAKKSQINDQQQQKSQKHESYEQNVIKSMKKHYPTLEVISKEKDHAVSTITQTNSNYFTKPVIRHAGNSAVKVEYCDPTINTIKISEGYQSNNENKSSINNHEIIRQLLTQNSLKPNQNVIVEPTPKITNQLCLQDFLKDLKESINAGTSSYKQENSQTSIKNNDNLGCVKPQSTFLEVNPKKSDTYLCNNFNEVPSHCVKLNPLQKKVDGTQNTYSKLNYLHKNKLGENKLKLNISQSQMNHTQNTNDFNLQYNIDRKPVANNLVISHCNISKSHHMGAQTSKAPDKVMMKEHVINGNVKSNISSDNIIQMNVGSQSSNSILNPNIVNSMMGLKSPSATSNTLLTESDQHDILLVLRQQNKLNLNALQKNNVTKQSSNNQPVGDIYFSNKNTSTITRNVCASTNSILNTSVPFLQNKQPNLTRSRQIHSNTVHQNQQPILTSEHLNALQQNKQQQNKDKTVPIILSNQIIKRSLQSQEQIRCSPSVIIGQKIQSLSKPIEIIQSVSKNQTKIDVPKGPHCVINAQDKVKNNPNKKQKGSSDDWENIMNQLLSHRTPSRGENALQMKLKKDDILAKQSAEKLRSHRISKSNKTTTPSIVCKNEDKSIKVISSVIIHPPNTSKVISNEKKCNILINNKDNNITSVPILKGQIQNTVESTENYKNKDSQKVSDADYDLLDDLLDDELLQEISELTSDEETYKEEILTPKSDIKNNPEDISIRKKVFKNSPENQVPLNIVATTTGVKSMEIQTDMNVKSQQNQRNIIKINESQKYLTIPAKENVPEKKPIQKKPIQTVSTIQNKGNDLHGLKILSQHSVSDICTKNLENKIVVSSAKSNNIHYLLNMSGFFKPPIISSDVSVQHKQLQKSGKQVMSTSVQNQNAQISTDQKVTSDLYPNIKVQQIPKTNSNIDKGHLLKPDQILPINRRLHKDNVPIVKSFQNTQAFSTFTKNTVIKSVQMPPSAVSSSTGIIIDNFTKTDSQVSKEHPSLKNEINSTYNSLLTNELSKLSTNESNLDTNLLYQNNKMLQSVESNTAKVITEDKKLNEQGEKITENYKKEELTVASKEVNNVTKEIVAQQDRLNCANTAEYVTKTSETIPVLVKNINNLKQKKTKSINKGKRKNSIVPQKCNIKVKSNVNNILKNNQKEKVSNPLRRISKRISLKIKAESIQSKIASDSNLVCDESICDNTVTKTPKMQDLLFEKDNIEFVDFEQELLGAKILKNTPIKDLTVINENSCESIKPEENIVETNLEVCKSNLLLNYINKKSSLCCEEISQNTASDKLTTPFQHEVHLKENENTENVLEVHNSDMKNFNSQNEISGDNTKIEENTVEEQKKASKINSLTNSGHKLDSLCHKDTLSDKVTTCQQDVQRNDNNTTENVLKTNKLEKAKQVNLDDDCLKDLNIPNDKSFHNTKSKVNIVETKMKVRKSNLLVTSKNKKSLLCREDTSQNTVSEKSTTPLQQEIQHKENDDTEIVLKANISDNANQNHFAVNSIKDLNSRTQKSCNNYTKIEEKIVVEQKKASKINSLSNSGNKLDSLCRKNISQKNLLDNPTNPLQENIQRKDNENLENVLEENKSEIAKLDNCAKQKNEMNKKSTENKKNTRHNQIKLDDKTTTSIDYKDGSNKIDKCVDVVERNIDKLKETIDENCTDKLIGTSNENCTIENIRYINNTNSPNTENQYTKSVIITLSNKKSYKATIAGDTDIDIKELFANLNLRNTLTSQLGKCKTYTVNVTHSAENPKILSAAVNDNVLQDNANKKQNVVQNVSETISLISDDEEEMPYKFVTEFGTYKVSGIEKSTIIKHQKKFSQNCNVVLKRHTPLSHSVEDHINQHDNNERYATNLLESGQVEPDVSMTENILTVDHALPNEENSCAKRVSNDDPMFLAVNKSITCSNIYKKNNVVHEIIEIDDSSNDSAEMIIPDIPRKINDYSKITRDSSVSSIAKDFSSTTAEIDTLKNKLLQDLAPILSQQNNESTLYNANTLTLHKENEVALYNNEPKLHNDNEPSLYNNEPALHSNKSALHNNEPELRTDNESVLHNNETVLRNNELVLHNEPALQNNEAELRTDNESALDNNEPELLANDESELYNNESALHSNEPALPNNELALPDDHESALSKYTIEPTKFGKICFVKLHKCDDLLSEIKRRKNIVKPCSVILVRCDNYIHKLTDVNSPDCCHRLTDNQLGEDIKRSHIIDDGEYRISSPVMQAYDIIISHGSIFSPNKLINKDLSSTYKDEIDRCHAEWFTTKTVYFSKSKCNEIKDFTSLIIKCLDHNDTRSSQKDNTQCEVLKGDNSIDKGIVEVESPKLYCQSLLSLTLNCINQNPIVYKYNYVLKKEFSNVKNLTTTIKPYLKRKHSIDDESFYHNTKISKHIDKESYNVILNHNELESIHLSYLNEKKFSTIKKLITTIPYLKRKLSINEILRHNTKISKHINKESNHIIPNHNELESILHSESNNVKNEIQYEILQGVDNNMDILKKIPDDVAFEDRNSGKDNVNTVNNVIENIEPINDTEICMKDIRIETQEKLNCANVKSNILINVPNNTELKDHGPDEDVLTKVNSNKEIRPLEDSKIVSANISKCVDDDNNIPKNVLNSVQLGSDESDKEVHIVIDNINENIRLKDETEICTINRRQDLYNEINEMIDELIITGQKLNQSKGSDEVYFNKNTANSSHVKSNKCKSDVSYCRDFKNLITELLTDTNVDVIEDNMNNRNGKNENGLITGNEEFPEENKKLRGIDVTIDYKNSIETNQILQNPKSDIVIDLFSPVPLSLMKPNKTYSVRFKPNFKRKIGMKDIKIKQKFRKVQGIDVMKQNFAKTIETTSYKNEFKRLIGYYKSVKFSFGFQFLKNAIDIDDTYYQKWPINNETHNEGQLENDYEIDCSLFQDYEFENKMNDISGKTLLDEITEDLTNHDMPITDNSLQNIDMGFGERSDRAIQNLKYGCHLQLSAAALSDVKHNQPCIWSENCDMYKNIDSELKDQVIKLKKHFSFINMREKVKSFFEKSALELNDNLIYSKYVLNKQEGVLYNLFNVPGLNETDFISPNITQNVVQVVQVGQLPVSAAAQNPVSCDTRVSQATDASPSQCSVESSPHNALNENAHTSVTKTNEYTELTNVDLSLPVEARNISNENQIIVTQENIEMLSNNSLISNNKGNTDYKHEQVLENHINENVQSINNLTQDMNNTDYQYDTNNSNLNSTRETSQHITNSIMEQCDGISQQKHENGTTEKNDQIANAMNAAGIATTNNRTQALVNIFSQKFIRSSAISSAQNTPHTYSKTTSINAMAIQQALAQILPPPLNHNTGHDSNQQTQAGGVTPQVLHIVQGKNASGGQITLVDNSQQSVINSPNATQVLHIVQNKNTNNNLASNGAQCPSNSFSGISLVDAGLQQGGNQLLHIVNTASNQKVNNTGQLLKRVNLLTNLSNVQGTNEQKMVQFVCKSADGKAIQLNAPHQRSMVLRLQPIETPNVQASASKPMEPQSLSPVSIIGNQMSAKDVTTTQQEIKSRSMYEENYAKFIQNTSSKQSTSISEKSTSLPKFNQAFGKPVFQDGVGTQKQNDNSGNNTHLLTINNNSENQDCHQENSINLEHIGQISSPPLLLRKSPAQTSQTPTNNLVQQIKQTLAPMNIQTMHGGVIYTRQIPVNIGGGQTINLITVPSTELIDEKQQSDVKFVSQGEIEPSIIKIVPQNQAPNAEVTPEDGSPHLVTTDGNQNQQGPPVLTQMRIKLPMLSKTPQVMPGTRVVRPSFFQIQRNVLGGTNQPVYQQLVLTAAPPLGQQTLRLPQPAQASTTATRQIKIPNENQTGESHLSSSTLEQLREFDMVLEQVKERSTVQPSVSIPNNSFTKTQPPQTSSNDTTDSNNVAVTTITTEHTQQVLYSIGGTQALNVAYVNRKTITTTPTTYVRSPDSSSIIDSPTSTQIHSVPDSPVEGQLKPAKIGSKSVKSRPRPSASLPQALKVHVPPKTSTQKPLEDEQTTQRILYILAEYKEQVENSPDKDKPAPRRRSNPPTNPPGSSKRKKSSSGSSSRRPGFVRDPSPIAGDDPNRTMGSEDSSCGTSQGDCNESCGMETQSPQDSPRKVARKLFEPENTSAVPTQPRPQPQRNVIVADGQTITVARGTGGKPATAVLMPANYILPVSMVKSGQQIAIMTNRGPKLLTVGQGEGGAGNALLLQRLIGPAGLKPVLTRPGVRQVRLPTAALHNLQAFNLAASQPTHTNESTASSTTAPTPPELVDTRATSSPWADHETAGEVKAEGGSSPECSEAWRLPSTADAHEYPYDDPPVTPHHDAVDRTVLVSNPCILYNHVQHIRRPP